MDRFHKVMHGMMIGAPVGGVVGVLLVTLAVALGHINLTAPQVVLAGGPPGLLGGLFFGGFAATLAADRLPRHQSPPRHSEEPT